jgi:hypothetical protein
MEKGRNRLPVTAVAYGLTNPGISRSLASRPPYRVGENGRGRGRAREVASRAVLRGV